MYNITIIKLKKIYKNLKVRKNRQYKIIYLYVYSQTDSMHSIHKYQTVVQKLLRSFWISVHPYKVSSNLQKTEKSNS